MLALHEKRKDEQRANLLQESLAIKALFGYNTPTVQLLGICKKAF